jgi:CRISPR system Cascade subunit CasD
VSTLLLRLAGPMQSWGTQSRFTMRDTGLEPSKSGIIGLLCAAQGRPRSEPVDDLAVFRMGVRADQEGVMKMDYHTAGGTHLKGDDYGVVTADATSRRPVTSTRYYLADADFLVGLEGDDEALLQRLHEALESPRWQLYLGRKAFVPSVPVFIPTARGYPDPLQRGVGLEDVLFKYPWPRPDIPVPPPRRRPERLRLVLETPNPAAGETRMDQPYGAAFDLEVRRNRPQFLPRYVRTDFKRLGADIPLRSQEV